MNTNSHLLTTVNKIFGISSSKKSKKERKTVHHERKWEPQVCCWKLIESYQHLQSVTSETTWRNEGEDLAGIQSIHKHRITGPHNFEVKWGITPPGPRKDTMFWTKSSARALVLGDNYKAAWPNWPNLTKRVWLNWGERKIYTEYQNGVPDLSLLFRFLWKEMCHCQRLFH